MQHDWIKSTLGHGEVMCRRCFITNREAAVLDRLNECYAPIPCETVESPTHEKPREGSQGGVEAGVGSLPGGR